VPRNFFLAADVSDFFEEHCLFGAFQDEDAAGEISNEEFRMSKLRAGALIQEFQGVSRWRHVFQPTINKWTLDTFQG
jgi:hypothetical protein